MYDCLCSQEQICEMYENLHDGGMVDQLRRFEDILVSVIKDVRKQQSENDRLERSYQRYVRRITGNSHRPSRHSTPSVSLL